MSHSKINYIKPLISYIIYLITLGSTLFSLSPCSPNEDTNSCSQSRKPLLTTTLSALNQSRESWYSSLYLYLMKLSKTDCPSLGKANTLFEPICKNSWVLHALCKNHNGPIVTSILHWRKCNTGLRILVWILVLKQHLNCSLEFVQMWHDVLKIVILTSPLLCLWPV